MDLLDLFMQALRALRRSWGSCYHRSLLGCHHHVQLPAIKIIVRVPCIDMHIQYYIDIHKYNIYIYNTSIYINLHQFAWIYIHTLSATLVKHNSVDVVSALANHRVLDLCLITRNRNMTCATIGGTWATAQINARRGCHSASISTECLTLHSQHAGLNDPTRQRSLHCSNV